MKAGVLCARGERILFADADGATVVSGVENLEEGLSRVAAAAPGAVGSQAGKRGMAVGSRAHLQEQVSALKTCQQRHSIASRKAGFVFSLG